MLMFRGHLPDCNYRHCYCGGKTEDAWRDLVFRMLQSNPRFLGDIIWEIVRPMVDAHLMAFFRRRPPEIQSDLLALLEGNLMELVKAEVNRDRMLAEFDARAAKLIEDTLAELDGAA